MSPQHRMGYVSILLAVLIGVVGCATTDSGYYAEDARIAADVNNRIARDSTLEARNVTVTSRDGVVSLSGAVPSADRLARATELAYGVPGVRNVVNTMVVGLAVPPAPAAVVTVPPVNTPGQPIDALGVLASYDPQTGIITFQDGRIVRMTADSVVTGPPGVTALSPGTQILVRNVQPMSSPAPSYPATAPTVAGAWRTGTVSSVDAPRGLIFLTDGGVVRVGPSTVLRSGTQSVPLTQLHPGSQIAVAVPPVVVVPGSPTTVYGGSALPREMVIPMDTPEVQIVVPR